MKRRDLKPGMFFFYVCNPQDTYWVTCTFEEAQAYSVGFGQRRIVELRDTGHEKPPGVLFSGPSKNSTDWDLDVEVLDEATARARGAAKDAAALDTGATFGNGGGVVDFDEDPES